MSWFPGVRKRRYRRYGPKIRSTCTPFRVCRGVVESLNRIADTNHERRMPGDGLRQTR